MMDIEVLGKFDSETTAPVFFHTDMALNHRTVYVMETEEEAICYTEASEWINKYTDDERSVLFSPPRINGINEGQIEIFRRRFQLVRDVAPLTMLFDRFPYISHQKFISTIERILEKMQFSEMKNHIALSLSQGKTKLELMKENIPYEVIFDTITALENMLNYTYNDIEKQYLFCFLQLLNSGSGVFYYCSRENFANSFNLSPKIVTKIESDVCASQECLSPTEQDRFEKLLLANTWEISKEDVGFLISATVRIIEEYEGRERQYYERLAAKMIDSKIITYKTVLDEAKQHGYNFWKLLKEYYEFGYHLREHAHRRRKDLKDYLD